MTIPPDVRANVIAAFPSMVQGSGPLVFSKQNGIWVAGLSFNGLAIQNPPPAGRLPADYVLVWDSVAQVFVQVPLSYIVGREQLTADRSYFVRPDGNDANNGLTNDHAGAFLTIGRAMQVLATLDCAFYNVKVSVADGTYNEQVVLPQMLGSGTFTLEGNTTTWSNCIITQGLNTPTVRFTGLNWRVGGFRINNTFVGGDQNPAVQCDANSSGGVYSIDFGANNGSCGHIFCVGGSLDVSYDYTVSGDSTSFFLQAYGAGSHVFFYGNVTAIGTRNFNGFVGALDLAEIEGCCGTFTGIFTGQRYVSVSNSVIETFGSGPNYFPGNAPGVTDGEGLYR